MLTPGAGLGIDELRLDTRQVAFGRTQLVLLVGGVERGEQGTFFDFGTDIDAATGNAPRHAEADVAFIAGLDAASESPQVFFVEGFDLDGQHRTHWLRSGFFFRAGRQHHTGEHQ
ncbi:hypothetical protein D3C81_1613920 [compost metagenome]